MLRNDERGQALVEFALVVVLFLLLLGGLVDLGRTAGTYYALTNAAREGARAGVIGQSDIVITEAVKRSLSILDTSQVSVQVLPAPSVRDQGTPLEVRVSYKLHLMMPFIAGILPNPLPLTASTVMRVE